MRDSILILGRGFIGNKLSSFLQDNKPVITVNTNRIFLILILIFGQDLKHNSELEFGFRLLIVLILFFQILIYQKQT